MRAVFQCEKPYVNLPKDEVNITMIPNYDLNDNFIGYIPHKPINPDYYCFYEGENHNQLTLTDSTEIRNMRAFIKRRAKDDTYFTEVYFEGNEADLEDPVEEVKQDIVKKASVSKGSDYDELSDWDKKLLNHMLSR